MPSSAEEQEVLQATERLLTAIVGGDYSTYKELCDESLTCFEPEALGHLVEGLPFHKFYFDMPKAPGAPAPVVLATIASPKIRLVGPSCAVIAYVRLQQKLTPTGPVTVRFEETRVWEKKGGKWVMVHFHKSAAA